MTIMGRQQPLRLIFNSKSTNRQLAANSGPSMQTKTVHEGATFEYLLFSYDFFLLATPIKPIRPVPNNQKATGTGTAETVNNGAVVKNALSNTPST
jgi:hypothetical protein